MAGPAGRWKGNVKEPAMVLLFVLGLLISSSAFAAPPPALKKTIGIGILIDVQRRDTAGFVRQLQTEIGNLLKTRYTVTIDPADILHCNWSVPCINRNYLKLLNAPHIDIIIGLGVLNSSVLGRLETYAKPLILLGVIDPGYQKIPITAAGTSGVHNLTYVMMTQSVEADLEAFFKIVPYKKIGLIEDRRLMAVLPGEGHLRQYFIDKGVSVKEIAVEDIAALPDGFTGDVDAVFFGSLYRFENEQRAELIARINTLGLPSFALEGVSDLKLGAMVATRPETDFNRYFRRVALNVERIVDGEDPAGFPLPLDEQPGLYLNMETSRRIGFSPSWDVIMEAELINAVPKAGTLEIDLQRTIHEALAANKALAVERQGVLSKEQAVSLSRTELFPKVDVSGSGTLIDDEHAVGGQAERTTSGRAALDQVIFSEQALADIDIKKHELQAARHTLDQTELDTVQTAGRAYLDILKAITNQRVRKDYYDLALKNLEIARKRLKVGYSGAADVYRWESEIASAKNTLFEAHTGVLSAKQRLNQLLYRPIQAPLQVKDAALDGSLFKIYPEADFRPYLDNPDALRVFTAFLVLEATGSLPEIKAIDASIKANERALTSYRRKRYLPTVGLHSQADRTIARSGAGVGTPLPDKDAWQVGVNASWTLFQGGEINTRTRQLRIDRKQLQARRADLIHTLELNLRNNVLDIITKAFNISLSRRAARASVKSFDLVQDSYEKGLVAIVQLLDAQNAALTARLSAANAVYDYFASYLNLERSMGRYTLLSPKEAQVDFFNRFVEYHDKEKESRKK